MKKKLFIIAGVVLIVVVAVIVIGLANINRIIESQREPILDRAELALGRDITVGDIKATLWPELGVRVSDVSLADDPAFSEDPFVIAGGVHVSVRLMPLLRKEVEIKRLTLESPRITVIRDPEGVLNYAGLMQAGAAASGGEVPGGDAGDAAAIPLLLAFADIKDGEVRYLDMATGLDHSVRHIDFTARDVSLESEVQFHRSVVDYNLALSRVQFVRGTLLDSLQVYLTEGPWSEEAHALAAREARRYRQRCHVHGRVVPGPISVGAYEQRVDDIPLNDERPVPLDVPPLPDAEFPVLPDGELHYRTGEEVSASSNE